jgi:hypothetical protein
MIKEEDRVIKYSGLLSFLLEDIPDMIAEKVCNVDEKRKISKANRDEYFRAIKELNCPKMITVSEELGNKINLICKDNNIIQGGLF